MKILVNKGAQLDLEGASFEGTPRETVHQLLEPYPEVLAELVQLEKEYDAKAKKLMDEVVEGKAGKFPGPVLDITYAYSKEANPQDEEEPETKDDEAPDKPGP